MVKVSTEISVKQCIGGVYVPLDTDVDDVEYVNG